MILESAHLKKVFDLINLETSLAESATLEIVCDYESLHIGANYDDNYYIEYIVEEENDEEFHLVMSPETFQKLHQLVNLWPKSILQIVGEGEHQTVVMVDTGKLIRERPVQVDCIFEEGEKDYKMVPPEMKHNVSVNAKNLRQMLEFCQVQTSDVLLTVDNKDLVINNETKTLGTRVNLEGTEINDPQTTMKLSAEANQLIIAFLTKIGIKSPMVYLLFLEPEYAFSIKVDLSKESWRKAGEQTIQLYTIHDIS